MLAILITLVMVLPSALAYSIFDQWLISYYTDEGQLTENRFVSNLQYIYGSVTNSVSSNRDAFLTIFVDDSYSFLEIYEYTIYNKITALNDTPYYVLVKLRNGATYSFTGIMFKGSSIILLDNPDDFNTLLRSNISVSIIVQNAVNPSTHYSYNNISLSGFKAATDELFGLADPSPKSLIDLFVYRCYLVILDRNPDYTGHINWGNALENGSKAASNIIEGFVTSKEFRNRNLSDGDMVEILYKAMLDRPSDNAGKAYWVGKLAQGDPLGVIINGFCGSQEFMKLCSRYGIKPGSVDVAPVIRRSKIEAFVTRCYQIILSRSPDSSGLDNWSTALENGTQAASNIIDGFMKSREFLSKNLSHADVVEILYQTMLNRASDSAGKANWVNALNNGQPYAAVINGFCGSQEFITLCNEYGIRPGSVSLQGVLLQGAPEDAAAAEGDGAASPEETADPAESADAAETAEDESGVTAHEEVETADGTVPEEPETMDAAVNEETTADTVRNDEPSADAEAAEAKSADPTEEETEEAAVMEEVTADAPAAEEETSDAATADPAAVSEEETDEPDGLNVFEVPEQEVPTSDDADIIELGEADHPAPAGAEETSPAEGEAVIPEGSEEIPSDGPEGNEPAPANPEEGKIWDFVRHCYAAVLGREADEAGLNDYTRQIASGEKTPEQIARDFVFSAEFQNKQLGHEEIIRVLYRAYLYREADAEGLAGWMAQLEAGSSLADIVNGFAESGEFQALINGLK
ncbi:MAG: DUF4214 domain-containing protein [Clostridia bacterium]|nr:DUF4214 domain-containing protein [Clostridia bacterium]